MNDNDKHHDRRDEIEVSFRRIVFRGPVAIIAAFALALLVIQQFTPTILSYMQRHLVAPVIVQSDAYD